jgi:DnaJ-class molecular chaperone
MNPEVLAEHKNKRGELLSCTIQFTAKKARKGVAFETINEFYETLISEEKIKPCDIFITAKNMDGGFKTLKSFNYFGDSIKYADEDYFSNLPQDIRDGIMGRYYSFEVTINY